jgi:hypothetical protein
MFPDIQSALAGFPVEAKRTAAIPIMIHAKEQRRQARDIRQNRFDYRLIVLTALLFFGTFWYSIMWQSYAGV